MRFLATCKMGLESTVTRQLRSLGIEVEQTLDARVIFTGDEDALFRALLWLRTAERVLMIVKEFEAKTFTELFDGTEAVDWKRYLRKDSFIHVTGKSAHSTLFSVSDCQSIVKKAIVEKLKKSLRTDTLPESGPEVIVEAGILKDHVTLALDACGAGLSRRGYRTWNVTAPLSETLGAGIVLLSRYYPDLPLFDPMCGSGTMPIEAAMIAQNRAPGLNREFAVQKWAFIDQDLFARTREEARDSIRNIPIEIFGSDIDARCIDICKKHAKKAGVTMNWKVMPLSEFRTDLSGGVLVCNPPYGERLMEKKEITALYKEMRRKFDALDRFNVSILSGVQGFETLYGKRADKQRKLSNGGMRCRLYQYFREKP